MEPHDYPTLIKVRASRLPVFRFSSVMIFTIACRKFHTINLFWVFFFLLAYQSLSPLNIDWEKQTTEKPLSYTGEVL